MCFSNVVRTFFNRSERMVCAKTDTPRSRWTHHDLDERADACYEDTTLWSRVIYTLDLNGGSLRRASTTISPISPTRSLCIPHSCPSESARAICLSDRSALPTNKFTYFLDEVTCKSRKHLQA